MQSLTELLSAIRPKDRTDKYAILSALYCLGAHRSPITAGDIRDLLDLHLQSNAPSNVNAALRKYGTYVELADAGPPLKWGLLPAGLDELRSQSGMELPDGNRELEYQIDIGIVCALEVPEFKAVEKAFGGPGAWKIVGNNKYPHIYRETLLQTPSGKSLRVVATTSSSMGLTAAAIATTHLIFQFRPRLVAMIGIAAGTTAGGKQFGDVLVADPSVDYMSGKLARVNESRQFLPDPYPLGIHPRIRSVLRRFVTSKPVFQEIKRRWSGRSPTDINRLHLGPLGAADQVIDDPTRILEIQLNWRKLIGLEMETYGVYRACHESPAPKPECISFKSICDFAAGKTDDWQEYAAFVAAEFAHRFFETEWDTLWAK